MSSYYQDWEPVVIRSNSATKAAKAANAAQHTIAKPS